MGILEGKRGLIVGIANDRSIASGITESILAQGGQCLFTHLPGDKMERRIRMSLEELGVKDPWVMPMDAGSDEQMDQVFAKIQSEFGVFSISNIAISDYGNLNGIFNFSKTNLHMFLHMLWKLPNFTVEFFIHLSSI